MAEPLIHVRCSASSVTNFLQDVEVTCVFPCLLLGSRQTTGKGPLKDEGSAHPCSQPFLLYLTCGAFSSPWQQVLVLHKSPNSLSPCFLTCQLCLLATGIVVPILCWHPSRPLPRGEAPLAPVLV